MKKALRTGALIGVTLLLSGCIMICCDDTGPGPDREVACAAASEPAQEEATPVGAIPAEP